MQDVFAKRIDIFYLESKGYGFAMTSCSAQLLQPDQHRQVPAQHAVEVGLVPSERLKVAGKDRFAERLLPYP
jgi:hypothetical protein